MVGFQVHLPGAAGVGPFVPLSVVVGVTLDKRGVSLGAVGRLAGWWEGRLSESHRGND